ncbi:6544_t:CDS:2, partial [Gigaspora rosea]
AKDNTNAAKGKAADTTKTTGDKAADKIEGTKTASTPSKSTGSTE